MIDLPRMSEKDASQMNPLQLAYMGDVVWEMIVRDRLILQRKNVHHMHSECVQMVNAEAQAHWLEEIRSMLSEKESALVQRGRNAHAKHPSPRNQNPADYADATGFEALLGFLYLTGQNDRIMEIQETVFGKENGNA